MPKMELLLAREDNTWSTEIFDVPAPVVEAGAHAAINGWFMVDGPGADVRYRKVVMVAVYNEDPEQDLDEPELDDASTDAHAHTQGPLLRSYSVNYEMQDGRIPPTTGWFRCEAANSDDAEDLCLKAYPNAVVLWVNEGDCTEQV